jgi:hypothetical protein
VRLGYFALGLACVAGLMECILRFENQPALVLMGAGFIVGWSLPLVWLRRRGWQIAIAPAASGRHSLWQFTIGDILIATTQASALLGLLLAAAPRFSAGELVLLGLLIVGSPPVAIIPLHWRRFWLAALFCLVLCAVLTVVPVWWLAENYSWTEVGVLLGVVGAAAVSLLCAGGSLRWMGYRLQ